MRFLLVLSAVFLSSAALAQVVQVLDPTTWYASPEAVLAAAALITPFIVKVFTALGKDWFKTDGRATQWLSLGVAVLIAGVGGFLSLGHFAGVSGIQGALQAVFLIVVAFLGANGLAKSERQVAQATAKRLSVELDKYAKK